VWFEGICVKIWSFNLKKEEEEEEEEKKRNTAWSYVSRIPVTLHIVTALGNCATCNTHTKKRRRKRCSLYFIFLQFTSDYDINFCFYL